MIIFTPKKTIGDYSQWNGYTHFLKFVVEDINSFMTGAIII